MLTIALFYLIAFLTGFALCIMPGPVAVEVLHHALKKQNSHALIVGLGAAVGDAVWAMVAFFGIAPFLKNSSNNLEAIFLLVAAVVTFTIGFLALRDARFVQKVEQQEEIIVDKMIPKRKRWSFLKGLTMMLVNPLGIGSWVIVLAFLKKMKIDIPLTLTYEIFFFLAVLAGAFTYSLLIVFLTKKVKRLVNMAPERMKKIDLLLGRLLIGFGLYFLVHSLHAFFLRGA